MDHQSSDSQKSVNENSKQEQLDQYRVTNKGQPLTTNVGRKISNDEDQLKAGLRGPSLIAYEHYKPIGIGMTAQSYIPTGETNNLVGIVSARDTSNFGQDFVTAVAEQRFWDRT